MNICIFKKCSARIVSEKIHEVLAVIYLRTFLKAHEAEVEGCLDLGCVFVCFARHGMKPINWNYSHCLP